MLERESDSVNEDTGHLIESVRLHRCSSPSPPKSENHAPPTLRNSRNESFVARGPELGGFGAPAGGLWVERAAMGPVEDGAKADRRGPEQRRRTFATSLRTPRMVAVPIR